jgi:FtsP/CotA-like multicopper oxidase with cupredoxin domain
MTLELSRRTFIGAVAATALPLASRAQTKHPAPAAAPSPRIIEARASKLRLLPEPAALSEIWGFDGLAPGPLLRVKQGDELAVRLVNRLDQPMSVHWHGMRGENAMDGVAPLTQPAVGTGGEFLYQRKALDAGLFCYRPSVWPRSGELMGHGLKGLLVVDELKPLECDGDVIALLDDWRLDSQGRIEGNFHDREEAAKEGRIAPLILVSGKQAPSTFEFAPGARIRLRIANLANARIMFLTFEGVQPFVIAVDSQPCGAFEPVRRTIPVAPGARFELMFDMPAVDGTKARVTLRAPSEVDRDVLIFTSSGAKAQTREPIESAPENPLLPREIKLAQSKKVDLMMEARTGADAAKGSPSEIWTINGKTTKAYEGPPLFKVKRGTPVTLGFVNRSNVPLVMHVHGHALRLLHDLDDGWEPYWRNAVVVPPSKTKHVAFVADSPGKWALHDDILEHEAGGLATWFEVS